LLAIKLSAAKETDSHLLGGKKCFSDIFTTVKQGSILA
jgi:hypothetical protein